MHIYTTKIFTVWSKFEDVICSKYVQNMRTYTDTHICTYTIKMHVYIYTHTQVHTYIEHFRIFFPCEKEIPINVHMCVFPRLPFLTETKCKEMVKERENYTLTRDVRNFTVSYGNLRTVKINTWDGQRRKFGGLK